jgi:very-short-patch-repair endonuclease
MKDPCSKNNARKLRRKQTKAEQALWFLLRDRRFDGFKFRRQYPVGPYILDFYCPQAQMAIELDGGGHNIGSQKQYDQKRTDFLTSAGIRVLRFWNNQVFREMEAVRTVVFNSLQNFSNVNPSPLVPLPQGERDTNRIST